MRALARDRTQRYPTAESMAEELEVLARRRRWEFSSRAVSALMHEVFAEKLAAQRQALRDAKAASVEAFLLNTDDATTIDWIQPDQENVTPPVATPPAASDLRPQASAPESSSTKPQTSVPESGTPRPEARGPRPDSLRPTRAGVIVLLLVLLAAVAAAVVFLVVRPMLREGIEEERRRAAARDVTAAGSTPSASPSPSPAPTAAPVAPARVVLRGQEGVGVFLDGHRVGATPMTIDAAAVPLDRPRVLTLIKPGFVDRRIELPAFPPGHEHVIDVALEPAERPR
jgi:hypothetical protein